MANSLQKLLFIGFNISLLFTTQAQTDRFAYAVTDIKKDGGSWIALRKLDTKTGEFSNVLIDGSDQRTLLYDASSGQQIESRIADTNNITRTQLPFGSGVAAIAYDRKNNRIYFTPMYVDQLRYVDLATMKVFCVPNQGFIKPTGGKIEPGHSLTRMVIAGDGYGYTISNDANHLYRFSTSGPPVISDLGALKESPGNSEMSIHNACGSGGGDMVADDEGNLYLITAQNFVYKITINNLKATFIGKISGLPEKFNTNGAAVDADGNILVSSSLYSDAYFTVDPVSWKALAYKPESGVFKCADMANSNILVTSRSAFNNTSSVIYAGNSSFIKLYPNPAEQNLFMVRFANLEPGIYSLQLSDILGRKLVEKNIAINTGSHTETVSIPPKSSIGFYLVKIVNEKNKQVFSEKLMVKQLQ